MKLIFYGGIYMKDLTIENAYNLASKTSSKFSKAAKYIVEHYVSEVPGSAKLSEEAMNVIAEVSAIDMAVGAELTKKKNILIGLCAGIVMTFAIIQIKKEVSRLIKRED